MENGATLTVSPEAGGDAAAAMATSSRPRAPLLPAAAAEAGQTGPSSASRSAVTPISPGPAWVPITGPISDTNSGGRP